MLHGLGDCTPGFNCGCMDYEPTEAEKRARWDVESRHHFHGVDCLCGFTSPVSRQRTEHITGALMDALRAARGPS